jgi:hypothetical protein
MSRIGSAILEEYVNEINEKLDDDNTRIKIHQAFSSSFSVLKIAAHAMNIFVFGCLFLLVVILMTIDAATIDELRSATNDDILSGIRLFLWLSWMITFFTLMSLVMFSSARYFRDQRKERLDAEKERIDLIKTIIEVQEELLLRHKLIQKEGM